MNRIFSFLARGQTLRRCTKNTLFTRFYGSIYEPEYLKYLEPEFPIYPTLTVQLNGYDFTVLEHYAKYVAQTAEHLDINVEESYPMPGKKLLVQSYFPGTTTTDQEYQITLYERNVKISELSSILAPTFIEVIKNALPGGVQINIHESNEEIDNQRYIPDLELLDLKKKLEESSKK